MRRINRWWLSAAALVLMPGCAMSRAKREGFLSGTFVGGILGYLSPYSESVQGPPKAPHAPLMAQQGAPVLELPAAATPTSTPVAMVAQTRPTPSPAPSTAQPQFVSHEKIVLRGVLFERNSSDLNDLDDLILDDAVRTLKAHPDVRIYVKCYSDSRGSPARNQKLSQERAAGVAAYLVSNGVPLSQLIVLGMGATHPVASNATAAGRAKNRRVELEPVME